MKCIVVLLLLTLNTLALAEDGCDIRLGTSVGVKVVEFVSGKLVHSKMALNESTPKALEEEIINLQDMGICEEKILSKKCVLKLEKVQAHNQVSFYRDQVKWLSWSLSSKQEAQIFVKKLKQVGFCS